MTNQEFVDKINFQYRKAGDLLAGDGGFNIFRGTAHAVSGYMEDLFALYMAQRLNNTSNQYLVDKLLSIRYSKRGKATTFKPDLAIIDKDLLFQYYDLKTNLGWSRDLKKYLLKKNELIRKIKGKNGWVYFSKEQVQNIKFSEDLKYKMVIFNGWNINPEQLLENLQFASTLENINVFILNKWDNERKELKIDNTAFDELI